MDKGTPYTSTEDFTVTEIDYHNEYDIIMKSRETGMFERHNDTENSENNAMFIMIYGLGGLLIFFVICTCCTAYYFHVKVNVDNRIQEHEEREEMERERRRENVDRWRMRFEKPQTSRTTPENEGARAFPSEDFSSCILEDALGLNAHPRQTSASYEPLTSGPSYVEINVASASPEHGSSQERPPPERTSQSTPVFSNIVRRQFNNSESRPKRPSSWKT